MTITDDYKIFADKYHNKQHIENPELRIQKLEEEIKELKEENQRHKWNIKRLKVDNEIFIELVASIKKETDKAK